MMFAERQDTAPDSKGVVVSTPARKFATFEEFASRVINDSLVKAHSYFVYSEVPPDWGEKVFEELERNERVR